MLGRIRAGVIESGTANILREARVSARLDTQGVVHNGFDLCCNETISRIDLKGLTGQSVIVYGQTEITWDLMEALTQGGNAPIYEANNVTIHGLESDQPILQYTKDGQDIEVHCDYIAACDGYHGPGRQAIPKSVLREYERVYPFGWLGLLCETRPLKELMYVSHEKGFALCSQRSATRSRYYIQCSLEEKVENWPDERFWESLLERLPSSVTGSLETGPSIEKKHRSFTWLCGRTDAL